MPYYVTCSIATISGSTINELSSILQSASYTGSSEMSGYGIPARAVSTSGISFCFNRLQSFQLSASEFGPLINGHPDILFVEHEPDHVYIESSPTSSLHFYHISASGYDISHDPFLSGSIADNDESYEGGSGQVYVKNRFSGSINLYHPSLTASSGKQLLIQTQSFGKTIVGINYPTYVNAATPIYGPYSPFTVASNTIAFGLPNSLYDDPLTKSKFGNIMSTSSGFHTWFHSVKNLEELYSGSGNPNLQYGGELMLDYLAPFDYGYGVHSPAWPPESSGVSGQFNIYNPSQVKSWDLQSLSPDHSYYQGKDGTGSADMSFHAMPKADFDPLTNKTVYSYHLTGKGTELISAENYAHRNLEFYDAETGKTRVKWVNYAKVAEVPDGFYYQYEGPTPNALEAGDWTTSLTPMWPAREWGAGITSTHGNMVQTLATGLSSFGRGATILNSAAMFNPLANIYAIPPDRGMAARMDILMRYHESKSIDTTGFRTPLCLHASLGKKLKMFPYTRPGHPAIGSFLYPESSQGMLKGIRINYLNKDYCFISASNIGTPPVLAQNIELAPEGSPNYWSSEGQGLSIVPSNETGSELGPWRKIVNGVTASLDLAINGRKCRQNWYFYTGGISGLVNTINKIHNITTDLAPNHNCDYISGSRQWDSWGWKGMFHITASYNGDTLILSSSQAGFDDHPHYTYGDIKVFTGSIAQFCGHQANPMYQSTNNGGATNTYHHRVQVDLSNSLDTLFGNLPTPHGGAHQLTLATSGSVTCSSAIETLAYKGHKINNIYFSNLHSSCISKEIWPQARYGFANFHNNDHYGIDNGYNELGPPMPDPRNCKVWGQFAANKTAFVYGMSKTTQGDPNYNVDESINNAAPKMGAELTVHDETNQLIMENAAERGLIFSNSAGNSGMIQGQTGSTEGRGKHKFFNPNRYAPIVDTFITFKPAADTFATPGWYYPKDYHDVTYLGARPKLQAPTGNYLATDDDWIGSPIVNTNHGDVTPLKGDYFPYGQVVGLVTGDKYGYVPSSIQSPIIHTHRSIYYRGQALLTGGVVTSPDTGNAAWGVSSPYAADDTPFINGPGNLGFGRIYPSLHTMTRYNYGPGIDAYAVFSSIKMWQTTPTTDYNAGLQGSSQMLSAGTGSRWANLDRKYGIDLDSLKATISGSFPVSYGGEHENVNLKTIEVNFTASAKRHSNSFLDGYTNNNYVLSTGQTGVTTSDHSMWTRASMGVNGGTSAAGPVLAGVVLCYLEANPGANMNDVRKFLDYHSKKVLRTQGDSTSEPMYRGMFSASKLIPSDPQNSDPRYDNYVDGAVSGSISNLMDGNARMLHFPYTSPFKQRRSGPLNIKKK